MAEIAIEIPEQDESQQNLSFVIISARINEKQDDEKKHVIYTVQVRHHTSLSNTSRLATIERRYTQFLNMYNALKIEYPESLATQTFPKKALLGNFDDKLIATRSAEFESFLNFIASKQSVLTSKAVLLFLQEPDLAKAKQCIDNLEYLSAIFILENTFIVLNNVYSDRYPAVLLTLCRLLACNLLVPGAEGLEKWADLALHRFEAVSDTDLLVLYVPLLQICVRVWTKIDRDNTVLVKRLDDLRKQGIRCDNSVTLLDAVEKAEKLIYDK